MLTSHQKNLITATVPVLKTNGSDLTQYFYQRMLGQVPKLKETFNMGHQHNGRQAKALANAVLAYAENIENPNILLPAIKLICQKHVSLNINATDYEIVGEHLLHSISEVLNIPMEDDVINAWAVAYQELAKLMIDTEQSLYHAHEMTKGSWRGWRNFTLVKKVVDTANVASFYLAPSDNLPLPDYLPGQYVSVRVDVPALGYKQPRQYSLSSAPNAQFFKITVKEENAGTKAGYVSSTLHHHTKVGDTIEVSAPIGDFTIKDATKDNVLISAGSGITPMVAMLEGLIQTNNHADAPLPSINFIHIAHDAEHFILGNEVNRLVENYSQVNAFIHYSHDLASPSPLNEPHRFIPESLPITLLPPKADFYLCGPESFILSIKDYLIQQGICLKQIYFEVFSTGGLVSA